MTSQPTGWTSSTMAPSIHRHADPVALYDAAAEMVATHIRQAAEARGACRLALAGGSTPRPLYRRLSQPDLAEHIPWKQLDVFWADERCVSPEHEASNYRMAQEALLDHVPIPAGQIHRIQGEIEPLRAAAHYADLVGDDPLDMVLLGMGSDGHTASLFPDTPELGHDIRRVVVTRSPVPPIDRVSLGLTAINAARLVVFLVVGPGKAAPLAEVARQLASPAPRLPAAMVRPTSGALHWFVDDAAAAELPELEVET